MREVSAWEVYLKVQEKSGQTTTLQPKLSLSKIAEELGLHGGIAEEYATMLHLLELVEFDPTSNEIVHLS